MTEETSEIERIERELAATRAQLDGTIDALQQKLSPGELMSQAATYFKEGSGMDLSHNIGRSLRDNPIPVALIGVGLGWLLLSGKRQPNAAFRTTPGYSPRRDRLPDEDMAMEPIMPAYQAAAYDDLATKAMEAGAGVSRQEDESDESFHERVSAAKAAVLGLTRDAGEAASAFAQRVEEALISARDSFQRMGEQAGRLASNAGQAAGDMAGNLLDSGRAGMRSLQDYGQSTGDGARGGVDYALAQTRDLGSRTAAYMQDHPLLLGALGVALGAGLGMLIPSSRYERKMLNEVGIGLRDQAEEAIQDVRSRATRIAAAVIDTVHDAAQREGLNDTSPQGPAASARELVTDTAGRVRGAVEETVAAGRHALERELAADKVACDSDSKTGDDEANLNDPVSTAPAGADQPRDRAFDPV